MGKTIVKKVPDEDVYYDWNDWVDLTEEQNDIVIIGDHHYVLFGESTQLDIIKGDYYDENLADPYDYDTIEELNKVCGGDWEETELHGYGQGDYVRVWYNKQKISQGLLDELDDFIMGKVNEVTIQEDEDNPDDIYQNFIPHDVFWKGKEAICKYLGLKPEETIVYEDDGYEKVYKYKELD